jgi:hypothetical protein
MGAPSTALEAQKILASEDAGVVRVLPQSFLKKALCRLMTFLRKQTDKSRT